MSSSTTPQRFDCRRLLQEIADQEAVYQTEESVDFGHPEPPNIQVSYIKRDVLLVVAYTPHFVYAQVNCQQNDGDPLEICRLSTGSNEDEVITCLAVVTLEDEHLIRATRIEEEGEDDDNKTSEEHATNQCFDVTVIDDVTKASSVGESATLLLKGMVSMSAIGAEDIRIAVVAGTNFSRVYAVELRVNADEHKMVADELSYLCEVLPRDDERTAEKIKRRRLKLAAFQPTGGVTSMLVFRSQEDKSLYVWITYGDGTMIRLHSAGFFPSIWQAGAKLGQSLDDLLGKKALVRCQVHLTKTEREHADKIRVVPLPRSFPSPFAVLAVDPFKSVPQSTESDDDDEDSSVDVMVRSEIRYREKPVIEALVYGTVPGASTLCFYTSEMQVETGMSLSHLADEEPETDMISVVFGGTKAIVGGMVGLGLGALRWTLTGVAGSNSHDVSFEQPQVDLDESLVNQDMSMEVDLSASPFPSLWREPITLYPGYDLPDPPRQIESCSIDPDGQLAALTDNLGRVLLFDLSTKQLFRMWKGFRDASCSWIHTHRLDGDRSWHQKPYLYLVIHSRQRRIVEVWRVRHGPRVSTIQVERGAEVLPLPVGCPSSHMASSYLIHSKLPGASLNKVEELLIDESVIRGPNYAASAERTPSGFSSREATLRLQHLRQLLSTPSVRLDANDIYEALRAISSVTDLATALDLLSESTILEEKLGVVGSTFHKLAVAFCNESLIAAIKGAATRDVQANPNIAVLSNKIEYHSQLVKAYDVLNKFQMSSKVEDRSQDIKNPSHWVMEGMGWASIYERVMRIDLDRDVPSASKVLLRFSAFASACIQSNDAAAKGPKVTIYFSDSSRVRRDILVHVFKPLLSDVFNSRLVNSIFDFMGIGDDQAYLLKCFGEWTFTLSVQELYQKGLLAVQSPLIRFLKEIAVRQLDKGSLSEGEVVLSVLYSFCDEATDLVRAFMLAVLCRDAAEKAAARREKMTYGRILTSKVLRDWDDLLRKLRVSLLVSLRLKNVRLAAPVSVNNVDEDGLFSVFELLAHDELLMSHKHEEIVALEMLCAISSLSFDPSTPDGDGPARFKQLQSACLAAVVGEDERSEYLLDMKDEDKFGSLLLFFRRHNQPSLLAAHRARLLASKWSANPAHLELLLDSLVSLAFLQESPDTCPLAVALSLDLWQSCVCPIYRAQLFGFDDVQELSEDVIAPLFFDDDWLNGFGKIALKVLELLRTPVSEDGTRILEFSGGKSATWPPVRTDHLLKRLLDKSGRVDQTALDVHTAAVISLLISRDSDTLVRCIPAIYDCFVPGCLLSPMVQPIALQSLWFSFLEDAVLSRARSYDGPQLEQVHLGEIETLCKIWSFDISEARTLFLLAMYEVGKDRVVDELLTRGVPQINVARFVGGGVDIACRRLHAFLNGKEMQSPDMRETVGMLDADLCEWIKNRARMSLPSTPVLHAYVSIGQTHLFALRLLSLSASSDVDTALRVKIHSMVVLSGTLVKVLEIRKR